MWDDGRDGAEVGTTVPVVQSDLADAATVQPAHDPTAAEPTQGDPHGLIEPPSAQIPAPEVSPAPPPSGITGVSESIHDAPNDRAGSWLDRHRDVLIRDFLVAIVGGLVVGIFVLAGTFWLESRIADRIALRQEQLDRDLAKRQSDIDLKIALNQAQLEHELANNSQVEENTRFVRQVDIENAYDKPFRGLNLSGASLSQLDLGCADTSVLPASRVGCANLYGAVLIRADLSGTNLTGAVLQKADLTGANLAVARLESAGLIDANLTRADLTAAILTGANLTGANLTQATVICPDPTTKRAQCANLTGADLTGANLTGANLTGADLTGATLSNVTWTDAILTGARGLPEGVG
jgi:uncharacterized protein YjbI with pentapeptide repeats